MFLIVRSRNRFEYFIICLFFQSLYLFIYYVISFFSYYHFLFPASLFLFLTNIYLSPCLFHMSLLCPVIVSIIQHGIVNYLSRPFQSVSHTLTASSLLLFSLSVCLPPSLSLSLALSFSFPKCAFYTLCLYSNSLHRTLFHF